MKKQFSVLLCGVLVLSVLSAGCGKKAAVAAEAVAGTQGTEQASTETTAKSSNTGKKIAVLRNMISSDHTSQFFKGCVEEGEALGYQVDTFMGDGDDVKMQSLMEQTLQQDYEIWIVSHANEGYQYDLVSKAVAKGIKVVAFDCGGKHVPGVTYTTQSDEDLTKISLDALIEKAEKDGKKQPINIIEVNTLGAIVPFDSRHKVVEQYEKDGKIKVTQMISPSLTGDFYSEVNTAMTAAINNGVKIDGVWTASTTFLDAIMDSLHSASKTDVVVTGIDISNTEIERLAAEPQYYCCAAVDPYVIGLVDTRIAVLKTLGEETPETYQFSAVGVYNKDVKKGDTMQTLAGVIKNFGSSEEFKSAKLDALRK